MEKQMLENKGKDFHNFGQEDFEFMDIPEKVSKVEAIIYHWVAEHYGIDEAMIPAWNITALADEIEKKIDEPNYVLEDTVAYEK